jgi:hypothetical protein
MRSNYNSVINIIDNTLQQYIPKLGTVGEGG